MKHLLFEFVYITILSWWFSSITRITGYQNIHSPRGARAKRRYFQTTTLDGVETSRENGLEGEETGVEDSRSGESS